jgi:uncharacterized protein YgiM (DUF1202 family)
MKRILAWSRRRMPAVVLGTVLSGGATVAIAEDLFVQLDQVQLTDGPGQLFDAVATVNRNDKLQVLERTEDGWIKVKTLSGKEGYVFNETVGKQPASGGTSVSVTSDAEARRLGAAAASKGIEPEAKQYASAKNYNPAALQRVIDLNARSNEKARKWIAFCKDGNVGPSKPRQQ